MKICGIYKIINTITGDFYIGSSKDVKQRWANHKCKSIWKRCPNNPMYQDMRKYGIDKFVFEIIEEVEIDKLKETEQKFIETLKPAYNSNNAKGRDFERYNEAHRKANKKYRQSEKGKKFQKKYQKTDKCKEQRKQYYESHREEVLEQNKQYNNQLCFYNGETITLCALRTRFKKLGIDHPTIEAKK